MPELETLRSFYTSLKAIFKKTKMTNISLFANFDDEEDMHYCSYKEDESTFSSDLAALFLQHGKDETVVEPVSKMLSYEQEIEFNLNMTFEQFLLLVPDKKYHDAYRSEALAIKLGDDLEDKISRPKIKI